MWSRIPDLGSRRALLSLAGAATLAAMLFEGILSLRPYLRGMGDTDDAIRLVLVRELMAGKGWYHPEILRMQPPAGALMHWSRLVDAGIAAVDWLFRLALSPAQAETAARCVWPMLWLAPTIGAACLIARRLGGSAGLLSAAVLSAMSPTAYEQFHLGRIDHHNVQIALCLVALAAACADRSGWKSGAVAGAATALGLAVGTEALIFEAMIGAYLGLLLFLPDDARPKVRGYGLALAVVSGAAFLAQTPPRLWSVSVCDTMGLNLAVTLGVAGIGVALASALPRRKIVLAAGLAIAGAAAAATYALMHPSCLHGPMGDVPPDLAAYIDQMSEMRPFVERWRADPEIAAYFVTGFIAVAALPFLVVRDRRWANPEFLLVGALMLAAMTLGLLHIRFAPYTSWFAAPLIGAAIAALAGLWRRLLVPTVLAAAMASPGPTAAAILGVQGWVDGRNPLATSPSDPVANQSEDCGSHLAYRRLRTLAPGLVLADLNITPYILAETPHSVLAGPYHRLSQGLHETFAAFAADPAKAEAYVRALKIDYVVNCRKSELHYDHMRAGPKGLQAALDHGHPPPWLVDLSGPREAVQIYKVTPR